MEFVEEIYLKGDYPTGRELRQEEAAQIAYLVCDALGARTAKHYSSRY